MAPGRISQIVHGKRSITADTGWISQIVHGKRSITADTGRISQIVHGKRSITADTALRLGRYFGVSPEIWRDLQSDYDLRVVRRERGTEIERTVSRLDVA